MAANHVIHAEVGARVRRSKKAPVKGSTEASWGGPITGHPIRIVATGGASQHPGPFRSAGVKLAGCPKTIDGPSLTGVFSRSFYAWPCSPSRWDSSSGGGESEVPRPLFAAPLKREGFMVRLMTIIALLLFDVSSSCAAPPELDVRITCRRSQPLAGGDEQTAYQGCIRDEAAAEKELAKAWSTFRSSAQPICVQETKIGGVPELRGSAHLPPARQASGRVRDRE